ncbi:MAG: hypothetical protein FD143_3687 [Ignavibacteria bacterium]|nr:MAG: hypothetical protein FD143_3687 [Ignavibacteria bacterium]
MPCHLELFSRRLGCPKWKLKFTRRFSPQHLRHSKILLVFYVLAGHGLYSQEMSVIVPIESSNRIKLYFLPDGPMANAQIRTMIRDLSPQDYDTYKFWLVLLASPLDVILQCSESSKFI